MSQKNANPLASYFTNSGDFLVSNSNSSAAVSAATTDLAGRTFFDLIAECKDFSKCLLYFFFSILN